MLPAIAFMLAAYTVPRIIISTMHYCAQSPGKNGAQAMAILMCVGSVLGVLLGLAGVFVSGAVAATPKLP